MLPLRNHLWLAVLFVYLGEFSFSSTRLAYMISNRGYKIDVMEDEEILFVLEASCSACVLILMLLKTLLVSRYSLEQSDYK